MNTTKTSILFAAILSLMITPVMIEDTFAAERIPGFMKTNIEWYATGQISEDEFVNALTYLMNKDIIVLDQGRADAIKELRAENKKLHEQMVQYRESDLDFTTRMQDGMAKDHAPFVPGGAVVSSAVSGMQNVAHIQAQIASAIAELSSLYDMHAEIMNQIKALQANEPESWDHPDDPTRFQQAHDAWQNDMDDLMNQLSAIQSKIEKAIQKLEQLQGELHNAQQEAQAEMNEMRETASHQLGPENIAKKHITNVAMVPVTDENGVEVPLLVSIPDGVDPNAFVQSVLRESYMETNKDLQFYADKVRHFNDMKEAIRDQISEMREKQTLSTQIAKPQTANPNLAVSGTTSYDRLTMKADLDEHEGTISKFLVLQKELETIDNDIEELTEKIDSTMILQKTLRKDTVLLKDASAKGVYPTKVALSDGVIVLESARDADALVKKWEEKLSSVGDDAQLANIDLQNALQKQQQTLQTMSNVSKMLHDTAMSVIRKIG